MTKTHLELLPTKLSPSRAKEFVTCPKKFFHKTIEKRREPNTVENTRGTIAHDALEQLYRLPREQRTVDAAVEFIKPAWDKIKGQDTYKHLDTDEQATEMLEFAEECVRNFFTIEDPTRFDPTGIEFHAKADLDSGLTLHGYIDRMDEVPAGEVSLTYLSDYKTGRKIPSPRYLSDTFFAMRIYALLIREMTGKAPHALRLVFIKHTGAKAVKTEYVTDEMLDRTRREIDGIWTRIRSAAAKEEWPAKTGPLCNWCHFQSECPDGMTMKK